MKKFHTHPFSRRLARGLLFLFLSVGLLGPMPVRAQSDLPPTETAPEGMEAAREMVAQAGHAPVIVVLNVPVRAGEVNGPAVQAAQDGLSAALAGTDSRVGYRYQNFPLAAVSVDAAGLRALEASPLVAAVQPDERLELTLADSTRLTGAVLAHQQGYTGQGWTVAVLDSGIQANHPFLAGKVVSEACFSGADGIWGDAVASICTPGGANAPFDSFEPGSGAPCSAEICTHGTHVAGIAAGKGNDFSGMAPDAKLISIQVLSKFGENDYAPVFSDVIKGLDRVYALRSTYKIAAVNLSLGGGEYKSACDRQYPAMKQAIDRLSRAGIATVVATGNDGFTGALSTPACISTAVSVGSTTKADQVSAFSNSAATLDLLAPGGAIYSSKTGSSYGVLSGTSMAAPHVAGAWAVLKQARANLTVSQALKIFKDSGQAVKDDRVSRTRPRVDLDYALARVAPPGGPPQLIAPLSITLERATVIYRWQQAPVASRYLLQLTRGGRSMLRKAVTDASACDRGQNACLLFVPSILRPGEYTWTVRPWSSTGYGPVSASGRFTVGDQAPAAPQITAPNGDQPASPAAYRWRETASPYGDRYRLRIWRGTRLVYSRVVESYRVCAGGDCAAPGPSKLLSGSYTWTVTGWNSVGYGAAASGSFRIP